ncbi:hypothetical protein SDC9_204250 [bioreactor metagenome]|uniref:Uncharacterized protein n=1 Tax=bioreactor metagenome TaxID=1076179 RepID=A0A645J069_9ZZZZ
MLSDALVRALLLAAEEAQRVITQPVEGIRNLSEWAKQQACWSALQARQLDYGKEFGSCLTLKETAKRNEHDAKGKQREIAGIEAQSLVVKLGSSFWHTVLEQGNEVRALKQKDVEILKVCASLPRQIPTEKQSGYAIGVLERLKAQGMLSADLADQIGVHAPGRI